MGGNSLDLAQPGGDSQFFNYTPESAPGANDLGLAAMPQIAEAAPALPVSAADNPGAVPSPLPTTAPDNPGVVAAPTAAPNSTASTLTSARDSIDERIKKRKEQSGIDWEEHPLRSLALTVGEMGARMNGQKGPLTRMRERAIEEEKMSQAKLGLVTNGIEQGIKLSKSLPEADQAQFLKDWGNRYKEIDPEFPKLLEQAAKRPDLQEVLKLYGDHAEFLGPIAKANGWDSDKMLELSKDKGFREMLDGLADDKNRPAIGSKIAQLQSIVGEAEKAGKIPPGAMGKMTRDADGHLVMTESQVEAFNAHLPEGVRLSRSEMNTFKRSPDIQRTFGIMTAEEQKTRATAMATPPEVEKLKVAQRAAQASGDHVLAATLGGQIAKLNHIPDERPDLVKLQSALDREKDPKKRDEIQSEIDKKARDETGQLVAAEKRATDAGDLAAAKTYRARIDKLTTVTGLTESDLQARASASQVGKAEGEDKLPIPASVSRSLGLSPTMTRGEARAKGITIPDDATNTKLDTQRAAVESFVRQVDQVRGLVKKGGAAALSDPATLADWATNAKGKIQGFAQLFKVDTKEASSDPDKYESTFREMGVTAARVKAGLVSLGTTLAIANNPDGRISDNDVRIGMKQAASDAADPKKFDRLMRDTVGRTEDRYSDQVKNVVGQRPIPPHIPTAERRYLDMTKAQIQAMPEYEFRNLSEATQREIKRRFQD